MLLLNVIAIGAGLVASSASFSSNRNLAFYPISDDLLAKEIVNKGIALKDVNGRTLSIEWFKPGGHYSSGGRFMLGAGLYTIHNSSICIKNQPNRRYSC